MNWYLTQSGFVEVNVTKQMQEDAEKRNKIFYAKLGNAGTHRKDKGRQRMTGYLAEAGVKEVFPRLMFSEDAKIDFTFGDTTFDVKAQGCNGAPGPSFVGTLYEEQKDRDVDFYIFARTKNDFTKVWITGFIRKADFLTLATLVPAGVENNNFKYDQARYEIEYRKLLKPQNFMTRKSA